VSVYQKNEFEIIIESLFQVSSVFVSKNVD